MLSNVFHTFRLLIDSMDFLEENGDGWDVLLELASSAYELHGDSETKAYLLLWMLQLSSFELKTNIYEELYARMLVCILHSDPVLAEASDLLLNLCGDRIIDIAPWDTDGYTILHQRLACGNDGDVSLLLARGPHLHRLGFDALCTPYKESPTSLAMYSSWVFTEWLRGLVNNEVDLEKFIDQELEQSHEVHAGWEKDTLLDLFANGDRPDLHVQKDRTTCSDCIRRFSRVQVQPYWRHLLERIEQRIHPDSPASTGPEAGEKENADSGSIREAASSPSDPTYKPDTTGDVPLVKLEELPSDPDSESESEEGTSGYPAMISIRSECMYSRHEVVCMECWLHYKRTGTRRNRVSQDLGADEDSSGNEYSSLRDDSSEDEYSPPKDDSSDDEYSPPKDDSSDDEYSPFLIHA
ncbi:hypothetical protein MMC28_002205 [Mycoblastus sanguinarius]|nr:hypothetical protein [Mycoblastus sanguinarius]